MIKVSLLSSDEHLATLCGETLNDLLCQDWELAKATPASCPADADLYIWDGYPTGLERPLAHHLFLVRAEEIVQFQNFRDPRSTLLVKPVTRAGLHAFLGLIIDRLDKRLPIARLRLDRDHVFQCLIQASFKLQEYGREQANLFDRAARDFRAPLTATGGYCALLLSQALGELHPAQREILHRIEYSTARLSRMVSAAFELNTLRQTDALRNLHATEISECLERALGETNPIAESKCISISVDIDPLPGVLYCEPAQIEHLFVNVLENACRFTPRAGEIEIRGYSSVWEPHFTASTAPWRAPASQPGSSSRWSKAYRIDIRHSGEPIPPGQLKTLFEECAPLGMRDRAGGGLALAVCAIIARIHGGTIWAENTHHGPRFSLLIPVRTFNGFVPD